MIAKALTVTTGTNPNKEKPVYVASSSQVTLLDQTMSSFRQFRQIMATPPTSLFVFQVQVPLHHTDITLGARILVVSLVTFATFPIGRGNGWNVTVSSKAGDDLHQQHPL